MARRTKHARAMTLIESILAIGLMVMLTASLFSFYDISLRTRESGRKLIDHGQLARTIAHRIGEEIRSSNGFVPGIGPGISGTKHEIKLQTVSLTDKTLFAKRTIKDRPLPAQCDVREIRYYLGIDPEQYETYVDPQSKEGVTQGPATLGIVRREVKTLRQGSPQADRPEEADVDLQPTALRYLRFRYFDGVEWVDIWQPPQGGMGNSLPQAVEITVGYIPTIPEDPTKLDFDEEDSHSSAPEPYDADRYTFVIRLQQADTFFGSRLMRASRKAFGSGGFGSGLGQGGGSDKGFGSDSGGNGKAFP